MSPKRLLFAHGELSGDEVIIDILEDNRRRLKRAMNQVNDECLHWSPDPGANSIAVTLWHMGRLFDVFLTQQIKGESAAGECWINSGWAERTGYDPRGLGHHGWGSVNGYTLEEVAAMPRLDKDLLLAYVDEVYDRAKAYLRDTPMKALAVAAPGFEGQYTQYQVLLMPLMDNVRHLGEIVTLLGMWNREQARLK